MHWLAVHLPALPLEVHARAIEPGSPLAASVQRHGERILRCNQAAAAQGVRAGQGIGAARALCVDLVVRPHQASMERELLERLAAWCIRFTPVVSLAPPRSLLLDVAASLNLFGGAQVLMARVDAGLAALGHGARLAMAPTPLGALVLAIQGRTSPSDAATVLRDLPALRARLSRLPISALGLDHRERDDLTRMGLVRVGDLLRLPRRGLRERLGPRRMDWLGRLLGESADPRPAYVPPAVHRARIELPGEVDLAASLIFPCRRLLLELEGVLVGREAGTRRLDWRLVHPDRPDTAFQLGSARPRWRAEDWQMLLSGALERLELPAPVREVALQVEDMCTLDPGAVDLSPGLFPDLPQAGTAPDPTLLDRLRARLGHSAVRGLALAADHRPERASRWCEPGERSAGIPRFDRPLWLLPEPWPLAQRDGRPWLDGPLDLGEERERIDTGWWDDFEVARDYFVAIAARGERLWIFQDLKGPGAWYLHGVFG
jgi:protein ImuB